MNKAYSQKKKQNGVSIKIKTGNLKNVHLKNQNCACQKKQNSLSLK